MTLSGVCHKQKYNEKLHHLVPGGVDVGLAMGLKDFTGSLGLGWRKSWFAEVKYISHCREERKQTKSHCNAWKRGCATIEDTRGASPCTAEGGVGILVDPDLDPLRKGRIFFILCFKLVISSNT